MTEQQDIRRDLAGRVASESAFHDARIDDEDEDRLGYAYRSVADVYAFCAGQSCRSDGSVLEVGCFRGDQAHALAAGPRHFTGRYTGIDISPAAIAHCRGLDLPANFDFRVDDANHMDGVEDASVDYAFGNGVLHHLDLDEFLPALARKLSVDGVARFVEPAQGNLALRLFRRMTPSLRTPDERPFDAGMLAKLQQHFDVGIGHHALVRPYLPMLMFNNGAAIRLSRWMDDRLLRLRALQDQAWLLQIELRKPRSLAA